LLEIAQANINATFDFARQLARVKSPSEFFELSTAHARKQFEMFTEQSQRLTSLAQNAQPVPLNHFRARFRKRLRNAPDAAQNEAGAHGAPLVDVTLRARSPGPKAKSPAALNGLLINDTGQVGNYTELPTRSRKF
jgi:phasin family protein